MANALASPRFAVGAGSPATLRAAARPARAAAPVSAARFGTIAGSQRIGSKAAGAVVGTAASGMFAPTGQLLAGTRAAGRSNTGAATRMPARMCGIIGLFKTEGDAAAEIYEGLLMLQHRGQDSAGMVGLCPETGKFREHKANGLVKDVFNPDNMSHITGRIGIGHVRYPTAGTSSASEAQPFFVNSPLGIFLIHNGNLTNTQDLRVALTGSDSFFNRHLRTSSDSEVLINVLADEIHRAHQACVAEEQCDAESDKVDLVQKAVTQVLAKVKGAYSVITMIDGVGLVAFRDRNGIRPLVLGKRSTLDGNEWCVASEDAAFGPLGFTSERDVQPGECIIITPEGEMRSKQCHQVPKLSPCIFEYIYLARPDSTINNISVYNFQLALGRAVAARVADQGWEDIDVVVPVPDGSRPAAIEIAAALELPYREGLVKNRYVGRTFIMPDQRLRELSVRRKLNAMSAVFEGKNVLLVDDSIVRGTTMMQIVNMCRAAGAKKVYLAITAPPVKFPNVYGVDMPSRKEFVADGLTEAEVCSTLNADGLLYQSIDDLLRVGQEMNADIEQFDTSCFTGTYVTGDIDDAYLAELEGDGRGAGERRAGKQVTLV